MKTLKKILLVTLICALLIPMGLTAFASEPLICDESVAADWTPLAGKYSSATNNIIAPKKDDYVIRTTGFEFKNEDHAIKVQTPSYDVFPGVCPVSAIASKHETALDGLSVELTADEMGMLTDSFGLSGNISFAFTEEPITEIAGGFNSEDGYTTGLNQSIVTLYSGFRELLCGTGKGLSITLLDLKTSADGAMLATSVQIVYDDGSYVNCNGQTGYRWTFTARNTEDVLYKDETGIVREAPIIDLSEGLKLDIRADEELGYIVSLNGVDYCNGEDVAYFPICTVDTFLGKEYDSYILTDKDYLYSTERYLKSMEYARNDIDLNGLSKDFSGYLTVGVSGNSEKSSTYGFTVKRVNGYRAAEWKGEPPCDISYPIVTAKGVRITVDGLYGIRDYFIAKGQHNSYAEIKADGYIVRVTDTKVAGRYSYAYTVSEPGIYTVLVRYKDGREYVFHKELSVDTLDDVYLNGLQVTLVGLKDIKVIRTAYGEYNTPGEVKRAADARNFSGKTELKGVNEYMIQYREEGTVTLTVEYNNGYVQVMHLNITPKTPAVTEYADSLELSNLEGLKVIRYAKGSYNDMKAIKTADGSKFIRPEALSDGCALITDIYCETYTIGVQYDDESVSFIEFTPDHNWGEWKTYIRPTITSVGQEERSCILCDAKEYREVGPLSEEWVITFDAGDATLVNDAPLSYTPELGDRYSDFITELPIAEKEGYIFKGWWNRERRIALTPDFDADKVFDVYLGCNDTIENINRSITLIPIWETEGEKRCTYTFINDWVEGFEPIVIEMDIGDYYIDVMAGNFPHPGETTIELDGDVYEFLGWYLEDFNFLLTERDMWDLGYLVLEGNWEFYAFYEII